jgi:hypothetical protein
LRLRLDCRVGNPKLQGWARGPGLVKSAVQRSSGPWDCRCGPTTSESVPRCSGRSRRLIRGLTAGPVGAFDDRLRTAGAPTIVGATSGDFRICPVGATSTITNQ